MEHSELGNFLSSISTLSAEKLVKLFVKTRAAKSAAQKIFDAKDAEYKTIMATCENYMLALADKQCVTGFSTEFGTAYTAETSKISIADDAAFFEFVKSQGDLDFFERRVSSTHVTKHMQLHDGVPPPGLNIFRERVIRVRKASDK